MSKNRKSEPATNLSLESQEGSLMRRFWAYLIDMIITLFPVGLIGSAVPTPTQARALIFLLAIVLEQYLYFFLMTWLNGGQSLGQKLLKVKIITDDKNQNKKIRAASIHAVGKIIYLLPFDLLLGWIIGKYRLDVVYSRYFQQLAHTKVIHF